jgi:hypothetical protein
MALRLALCSHIRVPNEGEIDHLAEVEKVFAAKQAKKRNARKKTIKKPTPCQAKQPRRRPQSESVPNPSEGPAMATQSAT